MECIRRAVQTLTQALSAQELGLQQQQQQQQQKKAATPTDHSDASSSTDLSPCPDANTVDQPGHSPGPFAAVPGPGPGADDVLPVLILSIQVVGR